MIVFGSHVVFLLILSLFAHIGLAANQQQLQKVGTSSLTTVPVHAKSCMIEREMEFPATIESREKLELRVQWSAIVEKIHVHVGDMVRKGELIASVDTTDYKRQIQIYEDYLTLMNGQIKIAKNDIKFISARRQKVGSLVVKGIVPATDLDKIDRDILDAKNNLIQIERSIGSLQKSLGEFRKMEKKASFYTEIDGIVTELISDPKSMIGKLVAMSDSLIARIEKPGQYVAKANLLDIQVAELRVGMTADVILPDGRHYPGVVRFISPMRAASADNVSGVGRGRYYSQPSATESNGPSQYQAYIDFDRSGDMLPSGLTAISSVVLSRTKVKRCLPWNSINVTNSEAKIRVFRDKSGWQTQMVSLGRRGRYNVEILSPEIAETSIVESKLR